MALGDPQVDDHGHLLQPLHVQGLRVHQPVHAAGDGDQAQRGKAGEVSPATSLYIPGRNTARQLARSEHLVPRVSLQWAMVQQCFRHDDWIK